jgi:DHA1 family inner membrane transport protein
MRLPLLALLLASFGIGTTEYVIVGLLPDIARDLQISIPEAGMLITSYSLSVAIGSPILAILIASLPRRAALIILMLLFILGNLLCALSPSYFSLIISRMITALCHGAFFGLGAVVAAAVVPPKQKTQAIAIMFAGLTLANVMGVPLGTSIGQLYGWRATFWCVVIIGVVAVAALYAWIPRGLMLKGTGLLNELRALKRSQVLFAMMISILASSSLFSVFTYIVPILEEVAGLQPTYITAVLLVFGVGITIGNLGGGRLADWRLMPTIIGICFSLVLVLVLFSATAHSLLPAVITLFIWGVLAFAIISPLQMRVVNEATGAPSLASTMNQSAFHIGNAAGAYVSGVAITHGISYANLPWVGAAIAILALSMSIFTYKRDRYELACQNVM